MRKCISLCILIISLGACSTHSPIRERSPSSANSTCSEILSDFISNATPSRYTLEEFPDLDFGTIDKEPRFRALVELHELAENRDQSKIILALLIQKSPELDADAIIKRYIKLYDECE